MTKLETSDINTWFDHHTVGYAQSERIKKIRKAAKELAFAILDNAGKDAVGKEHAIMLVRQSMHVAISAIASEYARGIDNDR